MDVRLVLMQKRKRVWTAQLHHTEATLGRARGCTVRIPSGQVSRLHCRLRVEDGLVTVEDLESVNGTFLNGRRVRQPQIVHPGDRLTLGPATFLVEYELSSATLRPLDVGEGDVVEEAESEVYLLDEAGPEQETQPPPLVTEADVEVVEEPKAKPKRKKPPTMEQPAEEVEDTDVETVPLAEQDEIHISDSGTLREFLIELDNADSKPGE